MYYRLDGAILCILDKGCLNETTFHENEVWFAVREKQHIKQAIPYEFTHTINMVALRVNRIIPSRFTAPKIAVSPILNWIKRQYFCETKGQESD